MLTNPPFQGPPLDENDFFTQQWRLFFQTLYDRTADWDSTIIEQLLSANSAAIAEFAKVTPDDSSNVTIISEMGKTLQDLNLQLAASISASVELQKRFDELQIQVDAIAPSSIGNVVRDLEIRMEAIPDSSASIATVVRDLEVRFETIPDSSAAVAELKKSILTKASKLSDFAPTTSAEFATVITDKTGTGSVVFSISPTLTTPNIGTATGAQLTLNGTAGTAGTIAMTDTTANGVNLVLTGNGATTPSKSIRVLSGRYQILNSAYSAVLFTLADNGDAQVLGAFACNTKLPQLPFGVGAAAIDLPTVIALANNIRTTLINNGIAA